VTKGRKMGVLANVSSWRVWRAIVLALCISLAGSPSLAAEDRDEWQQPDRVMQDLGIKPGASLFMIEWRPCREVGSDTDRPCMSRKDLVKLGTNAGLSHDAEFHYLKHQTFLRFRKPVQP